MVSPNSQTENQLAIIVFTETVPTLHDWLVRIRVRVNQPSFLGLAFVILVAVVTGDD
jgi:hypothetical protein